MDGPRWPGNYADLGIISLDWNIVGAVDLSSDRLNDIVWQNRHTGQTVVWYMYGSAWPGNYANLGFAPAK
jgi:hypothetical protein